MSLYQVIERLSIRTGITNQLGRPETLLIKKLLAASGVAIKEETINAALHLSGSQDKLTLSQIMRTLSNLGLQPEAIQLGTISASTIEEISYPFITFCPSAGFIVVYGQTKSGFDIFSLSTGRSELGHNLFIKDWTGVALSINQKEQLVEPGSADAITYEKWLLVRPVVLTIALLCLSAVYGYTYSDQLTATILPAWLTFVGTSILGLICSAIMVNMYVGSGAALLRFCRSGQTVSCINVLESDYAKIGGIPFADIGVIYYAAMLTILFLNPSITESLLYLTLFPVISVVYFTVLQAVVIKKWCKLCVVVHLVFIMQFSTALLVLDEWELPTAKDSSALLTFASVASLITIAWVLLRPIVRENSDAFFNQPMFQRRTLSDANILAEQQETKTALLDSRPDTPLRLGGRAVGRMNVTAIISTDCAICGSILEKLLFESLKSGTHVNFDFHLTAGELTGHVVVHRVYEICLAVGSQSAFSALQAWFQTYQQRSDIKGWLKSCRQYETIQTERVDEEVKKASDWLETIPELATPTIFIDGSMIHREYYEQLGLYMHRASVLKQELAA